MPPSTDLPGAVLGPGYRLGRRVGSEDEGTFEGTHDRLPGHFLIKLFATAGLSRPGGSLRLMRSASLASLVRDPHVVQLLDFSAGGDAPAFIVTELAAGRSLSDVLAEDGMLSPQRAAGVVESLARALAAGHRLGVVHGDLRPALVVVPNNEHRAAMLGGFGWAAELRALARVSAPSPYLAPEQQHGRVLPMDPRSDQFGLAALAYELLAACPPFPDEAERGPAEPREPQSLTDLVPGIPPALDDVLRRALSHEPSERFDDIRQFAARFREAAASAQTPIPAAAPVRASAPAPAPAPPSRAISARLPAPREPLRSPRRPYIAAALPSAPLSDVTEELDARTLWPMLVKAGGDTQNTSQIPEDDPLDLELMLPREHAAVAPRSSRHHLPDGYPKPPSRDHAPLPSRSADDDSDALEDLALRPPAGSRSHPPDLSLDLPEGVRPPWKSRRVWQTVGASVLVLALVGGGGWMWGRKPATRTAASRGTGPDGVPIVAPVSSAASAGGTPSNGQGDCAIKITSRPPADVWLDGADTHRQTPLTGYRVSCGIHRLLLRRPDTETEQLEVLKTSPGRPFTGDYILN